ncbi:MAG: hypothetical protein JWQ27_1122 [Ferruginibacter sp.]|nr:hypothetical protein [Ferruginibacter sp.]
MSEIKEEKTESAWETTDSRFVGFIDIMGFKDMVARSTHEEIYQRMIKIDERIKLNTTINWGKSASQDLVRTTTYSDSIMIYSKNNDFDSADAFFSAISALTNDLFLEGIPHKGSVSFGTMTIDNENSIYFGQPLIDAYLLQEEISFYGIVIHSTAEKSLVEHKKAGPLPFIREYVCPFKNGSAEHLTVTPMYAGDKSGKWKDRSENLDKSIKLLRLNTSGSLRKYIDNTESYIKGLG